MTKDIQLIQISDWQNYRRDGEQFLKTALAAHQKSKISFSPETLYNLTCMAMEKLIMAFLMKNGDLAENHTMGDLARALEHHISLPEHFLDELRQLDSYQEICDLENYTVKKVTTEDVASFLQTATALKKHLSPLLH